MSDEITKAEGMEGQTATTEPEQERDRIEDLKAKQRQDPVYQLIRSINRAGGFNLDISIDFDSGETNYEIHDAISTNLPALDALLGGGLTPGLHAITGGPSSYKTALMLQTAYLAGLDERDARYITDEIGVAECQRRLTSRRMQVERIKAGNQEPAPAWSQLEGYTLKAAQERKVAALEELHDKLCDAYINGNEGIFEMGEPIGSFEVRSKDIGEEVCSNARYLPSIIRRDAEEDDCWADDWVGDLLIIDAVNALRLFERGWNKTYEYWYYKDANDGDPRARMEEIVTLLDNWGRKKNMAVVGVFHGSRTGGGSGARHPSMADFKETSAIEYRAVSAIELVRAADMKWPGHPKPPKHEGPGEAVGLFVLKSRHGQRTPDNEPIWLWCDGAHNLIAPMQ